MLPSRSNNSIHLFHGVVKQNGDICLLIFVGVLSELAAVAEGKERRSGKGCFRQNAGLDTPRALADLEKGAAGDEPCCYSSPAWRWSKVLPR